MNGREDVWVGRLRRVTFGLIFAATLVVVVTWRPIHPVPSMAWRWDMPGFIPWVCACGLAGLFTAVAVARGWDRDE